MKAYPICLTGLGQRLCVVVGGGEVATRKVQALLEAGARVRVVSPEATSELRRLAETGAITWSAHAYASGDLEGAFLVIAATNAAAANLAVWAEAIARGCLINVVDDPDHCNFNLPAVVRRGDLTVAVSTGGASPALARRLRERLELEIGPEYAELTSLLGQLRPELRRLPSGQARLEAALRLVDSEVLAVLTNTGRDAALRFARDLLAAPVAASTAG